MMSDFHKNVNDFIIPNSYQLIHNVSMNSIERFRQDHSSKFKFKNLLSNKAQLIFLISLGVLFLFVFSYVPLFGLLLAFKDGDNKINVFNTLFNGEWVGFQNFSNVFQDYNFPDVLKNTVCLNTLMLFINFPAPILFALFLNEIKHKKLRTVLLNICIFPTFISWMTFGGIFLSLLDTNTGMLNPILNFFHIGDPANPINFGEPQYFWATIIITSLIKGTGWGSIIYSAAITNINPEIYEAAEIDGAGRFRVMLKITLPAMLPTITVFFLLSIGGLLGNNFEQFYVFQNAINKSTGEVLATYSFTQGISYKRYSFTTALGIIQSFVSLFLLLGANAISKKITGKGVY